MKLFWKLYFIFFLLFSGYGVYLLLGSSALNPRLILEFILSLFEVAALYFYAFNPNKKIKYIWDIGLVLGIISVPKELLAQFSQDPIVALIGGLLVIPPYYAMLMLWKNTQSKGKKIKIN